MQALAACGAAGGLTALDLKMHIWHANCWTQLTDLQSLQLTTYEDLEFFEDLGVLTKLEVSLELQRRLLLPAIALPPEPYRALSTASCSAWGWPEQRSTWTQMMIPRQLSCPHLSHRFLYTILMTSLMSLMTNPMLCGCQLK